MRDTQTRKARGAFFTPPAVARYLAQWAIRTPEDTILEPSCGEAAFLVEAADRLVALGANPETSSDQLEGVELFEPSAAEAKRLLAEKGFDARICHGDFFEFETAKRYSAVIGNPPFVRYQHHAGAARLRSLQAALAQGVRLSGLASSWAAFVVQAAKHVSENGRLALVLPAELLSVKYAQEVRNFLLKRFKSVRLITFEERIFPDVLEEVVLLLAEGTGGANCFEVYQAFDAASIPEVSTAGWVEHRPAAGAKWTPALLSEGAFQSYEALCEDRFEKLREWGDTFLGAVTGNNNFFALTADEACKAGLGEKDLVKISPPGARHLRGLVFSEKAWKCLRDEGKKCYLFYPGNPTIAQDYLRRGQKLGVHKAYKCKAREPWWRVPLVDVPDMILTYMNHDRPRLVTNAAGLHILNSVYGIQLYESRRQLGKELLPIASLNSVTLLGAEVVGRAYGGGLLKLEPREADNLPVLSLSSLIKYKDKLNAIRPQLAASLRSGDVLSATKAVDKIVLEDIPEERTESLRAAREFLFQRRKSRARNV